ncbi:MAG TPA: serine/threonine-protein kinase [Gemmatimonadaceae bacterium]|nr:serine/threonine-protein kinase [Gemmatimonadaceae bacterium]
MADPLPTALQAALGDAYRVERELSPGGMSRIFLCTERSLGRAVVVKVLPAELANEVSAARFRREMEVAARLQHPHILPVLTAAVSGGLLYFIMPYVGGESLRHRLARERQLPIADATRILSEVADALAFAHANGVVHRDVKPENILLEAGHAVLADFGIARALLQASAEGRLTKTGLSLGTPGYMAPEQAAGEAMLDARADVYALAVVGYEMLAGLPPFTGPSAQAVIAQHLTAQPRPLRELRPDVPSQLVSALERGMAKLPTDRFETAAQFREAIAGPPARSPGRRIRIATAALGLLAAAAVAVILPRSRTPAILNAELLAVAPFEAADPAFASLREEIVDVVSRSLDGAGALRTVAPSLVLGRWSGRADPVSATALGRATGAGLTVVGSVVRAGPDSVRLSASVIDATSQRSIGDFQFFESSDRIDRIADSLSAGVLRLLGRARRAGAMALATLGTRSLPAAKAFLRGEQLFRRAAWDSALAAYEEAFTLDSAFALAYNRAAHSQGWRTGEGDARAVEWRLRAGRLARGLSPRDSLLVLADSLWASNSMGGPPQIDEMSRTRRQFALLQRVTAQYPDEAERWHSLGDAYFHQGFGPASVPDDRILAAFERAIALDSGFAPAYPHLVELALRAFRDSTRALRYADRYVDISSPTSLQHQSLRLVIALIRNAGDSAALDSIIRRTPLGVQQRALATLIRYPDQAESAVRLARAVLSFERAPGAAPLPRGIRWRAAEALAWRGHLEEAYRALQPDDHSAVAADLFALGVQPRDGHGVVPRWRAEAEDRVTPPFLFALLPWLSRIGDTVTIGRLRDGLLAPPPRRPGSGTDRQIPVEQDANASEWIRLAAITAQAFHAVTRGDSASALRYLETLPDSSCAMFCAEAPLLAAQLLAARGRLAAADSLLTKRWVFGHRPITMIFALEGGRVSEQLGKREEAIEAYSLVVDAWANGDSLVQPAVQAAREGLRRLGAEQSPRRPVRP